MELATFVGAVRLRLLSSPAPSAMSDMVEGDFS